MSLNDNFEMSFFRRPITNKVPAGRVTPFWVYQYLRSPEGRPATCGLRALKDKDSQRQYKGSHLDYVTPSGVFKYCNDASQVSHSRLLCMDLDDLMPVSEVNPVFYDFTPECYNAQTRETDRVEQLKWQLIGDEQFNTIMAFRSPRGNGLKWWIEIDLAKCDHRTWFQALRNYLMVRYQLSDHQVDKQCANVSRACYVGHDPLVYLRTDFIENFII